MKILFDNNAFANLVQQLQYSSNLQKLKELVKAKQISIIGCSTLLQELVGLAKTNSSLYLSTLSEYEQLIQGQLLRESNEILIEEGGQCKPVDLQSSLLDAETVQNLFHNLKNPSNADSVFSETNRLKQNYACTMENNRLSVLSEVNLKDQTPELSLSYSEWFKNFDLYIQDWFVHLFKTDPGCSVNQLPHVFTFLGYILTRIYERNTLGIKDRNNDLYDRSYFTDAAVADIFVTNDKAFNRTAQRVPNKRFEVLNLDEFVLLIDKMVAA
jgi:hypothetical protein